MTDDLLPLLRKLADGTGGRRTGEMMRLGWIRVEVTDAGRAALAEAGPAMADEPETERLRAFASDVMDAWFEAEGNQIPLALIKRGRLLAVPSALKVSDNALAHTRDWDAYMKTQKDS